MNQRIGKAFVGCLLTITLLMLSSLAAAQPQCRDSSSSLLWEVKGENSTVHLFGSLHLGDASFYPLPEKIERRFREADHLVFEVDPHSTTSPQAQQRMLQMGSLPPGQHLRDLVSAEIISDLETRLRSMGVAPANLMSFRPWFITLMLTSLQYTSLGYFPNYGVEQYLAREVSGDTNILALESLDDQLSFLQLLDGEAFLAYTLASFEEGREMAGDLVTAWRCANKSALQDLLIKGFEAEGAASIDMQRLKEKLIDERNVGMAETVRSYLQRGEGSYFVAVGTAHFLGEGSVVDLLRKQGYQVTAVGL